jgi:hypothetical protein
MKNRSQSLLVFLATVTSFAIIFTLAPDQGMAQRFNHPTFTPHTAPAPAQPRATPPPSRPVSAPQNHTVNPPRQESRPAPQQAARPATQPLPQERPTINGGNRNFGNHDFNHTVIPPAAANPPGEPRGNEPRQNPNPRTANPPRDRADVRDHVNIYHTGNYQGLHPYYYHPYRPYYWGPHWHPLGFFLTALAADAVIFSYNGTRYYYDDGCYYLPSNGGYSVVTAPIGAVVPSLPPGYETTQVGDDIYYYFGGVFYIDNGQGAFQVVQAPPGAVITQLPVGAVEQDVNGETLLVYNNTYYQPISQDGQDAYEVVSP